MIPVTADGVQFIIGNLIIRNGSAGLLLDDTQGGKGNNHLLAHASHSLAIAILKFQATCPNALGILHVVGPVESCINQTVYFIQDPFCSKTAEPAGTRDLNSKLLQSATYEYLDIETK